MIRTNQLKTIIAVLEYEKMDDLISRKAAYDVLTAYYHHKTDIQHAALHEALNRVPSVDAAEVVRCAECYHYDEESEMCILNNSEFEPTDYCSYGSR